MASIWSSLSLLSPAWWRKWDKPVLEALRTEVRDRFGPLPPPAELLFLLGETKLLAGERGITAIEVEGDKLKLTRHGDFVQIGGKFPRLTKKDPKARLNEIRKLLLALWRFVNDGVVPQGVALRPA